MFSFGLSPGRFFGRFLSGWRRRRTLSQLLPALPGLAASSKFQSAPDNFHFHPLPWFGFLPSMTRMASTIASSPLVNSGRKRKFPVPKAREKAFTHVRDLLQLAESEKTAASFDRVDGSENARQKFLRGRVGFKLHQFAVEPSRFSMLSTRNSLIRSSIAPPYFHLQSRANKRNGMACLQSLWRRDPVCWATADRLIKSRSLHMQVIVHSGVSL